MAIAQGATNTFKIGLLDGNYDLAAGNFKIALFDGTATLGPETTQYTPGMTGEVVAAGYTEGGEALTITQVPTIGTQTGNATAYLSFQNVTWTAALTTRGALIYDADSNASVCVLDFGGDKTSVTTFTVQFPAATSTAAIIRIS
jgi:hypothetical protein